MRRVILLAILWCSGLVLPQGPAKMASNPVSGKVDPSLDLIRSYLRSASARQAAMQGGEMEVEIRARLPKLRAAGVFRALRRVSCAGQVTYQALEFSGDARIKKEVITRYLAAESQLGDVANVAVTSDNYEFRLKTATNADGWNVRIFQLKPKEKRAGLFKGELWLDAATGMPLREAGQFVKVPSIFLKRIRFVRDYEIRGGVSIPKSIESVVETRLAGRAELSIQFYNFTDLGCQVCRPPNAVSAASSGYEH